MRRIGLEMHFLHKGLYLPPRGEWLPSRRCPGRDWECFPVRLEAEVEVWRVRAGIRRGFLVSLDRIPRRGSGLRAFLEALRREVREVLGLASLEVPPEALQDAAPFEVPPMRPGGYPPHLVARAAHLLGVRAAARAAGIPTSLAARALRLFPQNGIPYPRLDPGERTRLALAILHSEESDGRPGKGLGTRLHQAGVGARPPEARG